MKRTVWHWILLIGLLLVATWLRVYRLTELPPGLHYDEAANGILASEIAFAGFRPIFITSYTGKEVLYFYLAGGIMRLIGDSIFALRLTSAFLGLITITVSYWLVSEVSRALSLNQYRRWAAILMGILLATHFPHLIFSRLGFRAIAQPLMQALTVATLLYAIRTKAGRTRWFAFGIAGVWLGLAAYSYLAVRLFPFVLLLLMLPLVRRFWRGFTVMIGTASVILLPFALFFVQNPETFWVRISQVSAEKPTLTDYANSFLNSFSILLGLNGDPYWRFNNPQQPFLDPILAILFVIGLSWLLWRARTTSVTGRAIVGLLWATPVIMILPTALAIGEITPSNLRAIGVYPFVLVPIALLLAQFRMDPRQQSRFMLVGFVFLLSLSANSYQRYFQEWGARADTFYDSDADLVAAAAYLDTRSTPTYVAALHYRHPTVAFTSKRYNELKWLINSEAIVIPQHEAQVVYPYNSPPSAWAADWLGSPIVTDLGIDDAPLYTVYQLPSEPPQPTTTIDINFSNVLRLVGYDWEQIDTKEPLMRLYWNVLTQPDRNFAPFVHLIDGTDFRWAQRETNAYPAEQWEVGETIIQDVAFDLPAGMPFAKFTAVVGLFDGNDRLPIVDDGGRFAGTTFRVDGVSLAGNPDVDKGAVFESVDGGMLLGFELGVDSAETGTHLPLTLHWQLTESQTYSILLTNTNGVQTSIHKHEHSLGTVEQRYLIDRAFPKLPVDLASGTYSIQIVVNEQTITLGSIEIMATERLFDVPSVQFSADVPFGEQIRLIGYELTADQRLTLVWQADETVQENYTVFVHVLNPDGTCCVWQQDTPPQQGAYPTSRWIADEIVIDAYQPNVETNDLNVLPIEIGLYQAKTGRRLPVGAQDYWILEPHPIRN